MRRWLLHPWSAAVLSSAITASSLTSLHFALQARLTNALFDRLVEHVVSETMSQEEKARALLRTTSRIQWVTKEIFSPKTPKKRELKEPWLPLGTQYLMDPARHLTAPVGACGSFTMVLAKALDRVGIGFRIAQMICNGDKPGCHILLEANTDGRWIVLDPLFEQYFVRPDGKLASFSDVSSDWNYYADQIPSFRRTSQRSSEMYYDTELYDYKLVRYTNWEDRKSVV